MSESPHIRENSQKSQSTECTQREEVTIRKVEKMENIRHEGKANSPKCNYTPVDYSAYKKIGHLSVVPPDTIFTILPGHRNRGLLPLCLRGMTGSRPHT
jgi:hypothetical protein